MTESAYEDVLAEIRGWYQPRNLVVSLAKDVDETLKTYDGTSRPSNKVKNAFATYLHETIHWWQHVGTTSGLFMTLSLPAQAHVNQKHFESLASAFGLKKPLFDYLRYFEVSHLEEQKLLNVITNNWHDMYFSRMLLCDPRAASEFINDPVYESQAHAHLIHFSSILSNIESSSKGFKFQEASKRWMKLYDELKKSKTPDFYYGSSVRLPKIGIVDIMEGHARFCDLQYRSYSGNDSTLDGYLQDGYLSERYFIAFKFFLDTTGLAWPTYVTDQTINLFLFVCDYALNTPYPYPFDPIDKFEQINELFSPGVRFLKVCSLLKKQDVKTEAYQLSATPGAEAYAALDILFSELLYYPSIKSLYLKLKELIDLGGDKIDFEEAFSRCEYTGVNIFTRFVMSHHHEFIKCRIMTPHFLCWPSSFATTAVSSESDFNAFSKFFKQHDPPLVLDNNQVVKVSKTYITQESKAPELLNDLLSFFVIYDLTDKLIKDRGEFDFEQYRWFSDNFSLSLFMTWLKPNFVRFFGVKPEDITTLEI